MKKTAYITGGSKGIGLGIAEALLKEGVSVAITARTQNDLVETEKHLKTIGDAEVLIIKSDVRNLADEEKAIQQVVDKWGGLDFCIANAGVGRFSPIDEMSAEDWNSVIDINLTGVFNTVKAAIPALKKSKGYIFTISSLAGTNFFENGAAYNASKFGVVGFSQAIMLDLRPYDIKVTTIMPGSVATYFNGHTPTDADAWKIQPEDIGQMVVDLIRMNPRTLPSKVEVRPSVPPSARK
ncbi:MULTISPECIES: SDR family oxidoreductase [Cellulophaga]|uniref:3-oxoacyl-(Acyl-carrier-protein) reductase n=2 Tax=Cellulophaga TaxID=104264 RepID=F0RBT3_CELLC|nr:MULTISPECIES: SDR family oxidoreductase [Cellulophaga]ADY28549.1 3-oxoacyl-(acyl-carrier-protein) reductase [Cellulophaga lytica DSM 7489]AIM59607.1 short-chain dehydrogenase [Cellulophaga lytica]EWH10010.1 short chain dehydrogenase [Cellulophaga geojensis KL-A]TVZ08879.1 NADP-dependent 3-hydroxy acid dehydrogenase YdfG [Cellulophaga sp. RHA_52]WQG77273.1 SDR family oxidoreductase [Cellulophaga lytica]